MKILFVFEKFDKSELLLAKQTALRNKYELFVLAREDDDKIAEIKESGGNFEYLHIKHRLDFNAVKKIKEVVEKNSIDLIYAPSNRGLATSLFATRKNNIPIITYRGTLGHLSFYSPVSRLAHLNKRVSAIVSNCDAVKDYLYELGVPKTKLYKIYKGHDPNWYNKPTEKTLDDLGVPKKELNMCSVANFRPLKGIAVLLKALHKLNKKDSIHLTLIGENRDPNLEPLVKKLGLEEQVTFLGFRSDATELMQLFDVNCVPSTKREGLARSVVESQLQGIPAIVSDTGGLPEIVEHKNTGLVVAKNDVQSLMLAVKYCLNNPDDVKSFGRHASVVSEKKFNTKKYLTEMFKLFDSFK